MKYNKSFYEIIELYPEREWESQIKWLTGWDDDECKMVVLEMHRERLSEKTPKGEAIV